jgi:two-component system, OmpR family, KDP operon response regulator KdpE
MKAKILAVEDDEQFSYLLGELLQDGGYQVLYARDGVEAVQMVQEHRPDLVLLDVLMPCMDGWETCRRIREISDVPIIMLSCLKSELDKVRGLELGADDYITKPISHMEFMARIRAALRRSSHSFVAKEILEVDERLIVDRARSQVFVDEQAAGLSPIEYKLLNCFLDNAGRILTHQSLLTQVWGWEYADETDYLKVYIHTLRKKIEKDSRNPRYIITERGLGYRFEMPCAF